MTYQISPNEDSNWAFRYSANPSGETATNNRRFIPSFLINHLFTSQFIAVGISVTTAGANWRFGGYLAQEFDFGTTGYRESGKSFFRTEDLLINNVTILKLPVTTDTPYKLRYFPPSWFSDLTIQVWEYTGEVSSENNNSQPTEDSLVELREQISLGFSEVRGDVSETFTSSTAQRLEISNQLKEIDAGIYTLAEGLAVLLPPQDANRIISDTERRLNLDLGYL